MLIPVFRVLEQQLLGTDDEDTAGGMITPFAGCMTYILGGGTYVAGSTSLSDVPCQHRTTCSCWPGGHTLTGAMKSCFETLVFASSTE